MQFLRPQVFMFEWYRWMLNMAWTREMTGIVKLGQERHLFFHKSRHIEVVLVIGLGDMDH